MTTSLITPMLTDENVEDLVDCAGDGIGYWASRGEVNVVEKTYRVIERGDNPTNGETPADKTLTWDDIRASFAYLASEGKLPDWQMREIEFNNLGFAAEVGDMVVQHAMFGEIVFN